MPTITLDDTNRITIPSELLDRLGLKAGSRLNVERDGEGRLVLTPLPEPPAPAPAPPSLHESIDRKNLETSIQFVKGAGPKLAEALAKKGLATVDDLLYLLPNR